MRVALISHLADVSGATRVLLDLGEGLKGTELEPWAVLPSPGPLEPVLRRRGIPYRVFRKDPHRTATNPLGSPVRLADFSALALLALRLCYIARLTVWLRRAGIGAAWVNG